MRNKKNKWSTTFRIVASMLLINMLTQLFYPTISYALTSGPNAPEYSSFEPVDVTDMVNLVTGDFNYTLPILDVPGPEGGYPLALSYHAGIMPDQEASWVGLGWSLNAGAINRTVNLFADDAFEASQSLYDYWSGGESSEFSVGLGYNGVNFGLTFAEDTYRGSGVGFNVGVGIPVGGSGGSAQVGVGVGPYGDAYASLGVGVSGKTGSGVGISASAGLVYSFSDNTIGFYQGAGLSLAGVSALDFSIATSESSSGSASVSVGGITHNSYNANYKNVNINSSGSGFAASIPTPAGVFSFSFSESYTRYWSANSDVEYQFGALYPSHQDISCNDPSVITPSTGYCSKHSFDSYASPNPASANAFSTNPDTEMGTSMPAFDSYSVTAQGLGGNIRPYYLDDFRYMYRRNNADINFFNNGNPNASGVKRTSFRFMDDFSNYHVYDNSLSFASYDPNTTSVSASVGKLGTADPNGSKKQRYLPGSKHIEWFTNDEIVDGTARAKGLAVETRGTTFSPLNGNGLAFVLNKQIGAFMITNSNGVTYHYTQPVYAYNEYSYSEKWVNGEISSRRTDNNQPYAYTWLLTAITGPDYIDRGTYGPSDEDWGYWVAFDYGNWSDVYKWRYPSVGMEKDIDSEVSVKSGGIKQLYYLDAIRTRSHTALFIKSIRNDSKGVIELENGGFGKTGTDASVSTLRLDRILLFTNAGLGKGLAELGNIASYNQLKLNNRLLGSGPSEKVNNIPIHNWYNVLDIYDLQALSSTQNLNKAAIREIAFEYDYSRCTSTDNSLSNFNFVPTTTPTDNGSGKLTLNKLSFYGAEGERYMPSTTFEYSTTNPSYNKDHHDNWGHYLEYGNELYKNRRSSGIAAEMAQIEAWSLKKINTGIGASVEVEYEPDSYSTSLFTRYRSVSIKSIEMFNPKPDGTCKYNSPYQFFLHLSDINELKSYDWVKLCVTFEIPSTVTGGSPSYSYIEYSKDTDRMSIGRKDLFYYTDKAFMDNNPTMGYASPQAEKDMASKFYKDLGPSENWLDYTVTFKNKVVAASLIFDQNNAANETPNIGGGLRTKSVSVSSDNFIKRTNYTYSKGMTPWDPMRLNVDLASMKTSKRQYQGGVCTLSETTHVANDSRKALKVHKNGIYKTILNNLIANKSILPGPGVLYGKVEVSDEVIDKTKTPITTLTVPGKSVYEFIVPTNPDEVFVRSAPEIKTAGQTIQYTVLKDYSSKIGMLKSVTVNGANNKVLSVQTKNYLHETIPTSTYPDYGALLKGKVNHQGRMDELYKEERRLVSNLSNPYQHMITQIERYPTVQTGQTFEDKKRGLTSTSGTVKFDPYSGRPTSTWTTDSYGNKYVTETEPAYTIYPYMGQKVASNAAPNPLNKNMLTQNASSYTYKVSTANNRDYTLAPPTDAEKLGLVSASVQTWTTAIDVLNPTTGSIFKQNATTIVDAEKQAIWRKESAYVWKGNASGKQADGTQAIAGLTADKFANWDGSAAPSTTTRWQKQGAYVLYDVYSHELEVSDINNVRASVLYDPKQRYVIASASNARQGEIAYSGAEYYYETLGRKEGNVLPGNGTPYVLAPDFSHTGLYSLKVDNGKEGFNCTIASTNRISNRYLANVWVYLPGTAEYNLTDAELYYKLGTTGSETKTIPVLTKKARSWYLLELEIDASAGAGKDLIIGCRNKNSSRSIYFDDFRVLPMEASMSTYVYDPYTSRMSYVLDNDHFYTRYQYDKAGRMVASFQEWFYYAEKKLGTNSLNYGKNN